jgi:hypothetical protein
MKTQTERSGLEGPPTSIMLLIAALAISRTGIAQQEENVGDRIYELSVDMADAGAFHDCATFREDHSLQLAVSNGLAITWSSVAGDRTGLRFHAVTTAANPYGLALHGAITADGISGNAVNDRGETYTFTGRLNPDCVVRPAGHSPGDPRPPMNTPDPYGAPSRPVLYEPTEESIAGRIYDMRLYGGDRRNDCYQFLTNGVLATTGGVNLTWRMDGLNTAEGTFQAVGSPALGSAGVALFGQRMPWGELRMHGFDNQERGLRLYVGSGQETSSCIN